MNERVVVLGSGYAGTGAVRALEEALPPSADLTWVSDVDHHLLLHESHRCIRDPDVADAIAIPVEEIAAPDTRFRQGTVADVDTNGREVHLADGDAIPYDYLLVGLGSRTAFYGIDGLAEHALTLKCLEDALAIHDAVSGAAREATRTDPGTVVVAGAGLSGIQVAGEVAALREARSAPLEVKLLEGLEEVLPDGDPELQAALRRLLEERDVTVRTGAFVEAVDDDHVHVGGEEIDYDVLVWTGGIAGHRAVVGSNVTTDERTDRIDASETFETSDERVFAVGDAALVEQPDGGVAPPTAQAAWQAAEVAGRNLARALRGQPLESWTHREKGTVVSVGDAAVAHDVIHVPVSTFGGLPARLLKKAIAARWIADVASVRRAVRAWPDM